MIRNLTLKQLQVLQDYAERHHRLSYDLSLLPAPLCRYHSRSKCRLDGYPCPCECCGCDKFILRSELP